ncbi:anti-sigma factor [Luedemannella helvata]|uniref:Regulator of SigK n=1 Tax=Luedemannella helvata TaxID=349315 RepID=A0ABN2JRP1_9ACTN
MSVDIHALSGAYALNALDDVERAAFARHVRDCTACATEVAELRETAARLADTVAQAPPPRLRERVLAEITRTRQTRRSGTDDTSSVRRWRRWAALASAAVVVAVAAATASWVVSDQRVREERARADRLAADQAEMNDVLTAADLMVRTVPVAGGRVTLAESRSREAAVVVMSDLPVPPDGRVYQLWLMRGQAEAVSAAVMEPGQRAGMALVPELGDADQVGVTVEPAGGSTGPTSPALVTIPLA